MTLTLPGLRRRGRHQARHAAPVTGTLDARRALLVDLAREAFTDGELAVGGRLHELTHQLSPDVVAEQFGALVRAVHAEHDCHEAAIRADADAAGTHLLAARHFGEQVSTTVALLVPGDGSSWSKAAARPARAMVLALEAGDPGLYGGAR